MKTVSSLAERLDMTADTAVEKLRYMLFEVEGVDSVITDEQCDLLIDIDENPDVADRVRNDKLKVQKKAAERTERLKEAAKKAAAKRKSSKAAAAMEAEAAAAVTAEAAAPVEKAAGEPEVAEEPVPAKKTAARAKKEAVGEAVAHEDHPHPVAEIVHPEPGQELESLTGHAPAAAPQDEHEKPATPAAHAPRAEHRKGKKKEAAPSIVIGAGLERTERVVQIVRADGTQIEAPELEIIEPEVPAVEEEEEETGLLAEAERRQEEEEKRKAKLAARSLVKPDPAVVAEVKRRAAERMQKLQVKRAEPSKKTGVGKTARKKQKKAEKQRAEENMRRDAAAAVRTFEAAGPTGLLPRRRKRRRDRDDDTSAEFVEETDSQVIVMDESILVEELADEMGVTVNDVILDLMDLNILATKNQALSLDVVRSVAEKRGFEVRSEIPEETEVLAEEPDDPADLHPRPPVITVMGHVDHGKTTLLDRVRTANVAEGEFGGITQHIAAYDVPIANGRVVFLDTPGHEAFTQMRARGAQITDVVVLVVAADDGVMPQTVEAIDHAKAAGVPIVVAVNKCDKPGAQPDRIRQELTKYELLDEQWGGKTIIKDISAKTGAGVEELMELLVLESQLLELKANPNKPARGVIIESEISRGQGPVAWVLVRAGTLRIGDVFLAGETHGRVRSITNARGESLAEAGPATPVVVTGFSVPPAAGDLFAVVRDERIARVIAAKRVERTKQKQGQGVRHITLEDFHSRILAGETPELRVLVKADVQGSVDVLQTSLAKQGTEEVRLRIVHAGVGGINESDVLLASASDAVIIGFHVTASARVRKLAEQEGVDVRTYRIIYEVIDDIRRALEGMLTPDTKEVITGHAEIRAIFRSSSLGNIAGCYVQDGEIPRAALARIIRNDVVVHDGKIGSLRREKDDARSVAAGFECGIKMDNFEDIKSGDIIETYRTESVAKTLS